MWFCFYGLFFNNSNLKNLGIRCININSGSDALQTNSSRQMLPVKCSPKNASRNKMLPKKNALSKKCSPGKNALLKNASNQNALHQNAPRKKMLKGTVNCTAKSLKCVLVLIFSVFKSKQIL